MSFLVFSQEAETGFPLERSRAQARAHFDSVVLAGEHGRFLYFARGARAEFDVRGRSATPSDWETARSAEASRGGGLADLAARCRTVFEVEPRGETPEWLAFEFSALVASVTLGPVVTPGRDAILGVRSARERANALRSAPALLR